MSQLRDEFNEKFALLFFTKSDKEKLFTWLEENYEPKNFPHERVVRLCPIDSNRFEQQVRQGVSQPVQTAEEIIILNWMDGGRTKYEKLEQAKKEFDTEKEKCIKNNWEFDKMLLVKIDEFNNID